MSFKVVRLREGIYDDDEYFELSESEEYRGNVVLGRTNSRKNYEDREVIDDSQVDQYEQIPGGDLEPPLSRNHIFVSENAQFRELTALPFEAQNLDTGKMDFDIWDLNSYAGTEVDSYDPETGNPIYRLAEDHIKIKPLNHYLGFSGSRNDMKNDIEAMDDELSQRGFETSTVPKATWSEVKDELSRIKKMTDLDSNTVLTYSGHANSNGDMSMEDQHVSPDQMVREASQLDGNKILIIDQCYAGQFAENLDYEVPSDMSIYMSSGPENKSMGNSNIQGEPRGRYTGRIADRLGNNQGEISIEDIHKQIIQIGKVSSHNPIRLGSSPNLSKVK